MQGYSIVWKPVKHQKDSPLIFNARWILSIQNDELQERMSEDKKKTTG